MKRQRRRRKGMGDNSDRGGIKEGSWEGATVASTCSDF